MARKQLEVEGARVVSGGLETLQMVCDCPVLGVQPKQVYAKLISEQSSDRAHLSKSMTTSWAWGNLGFPAPDGPC